MVVELCREKEINGVKIPFDVALGRLNWTPPPPHLSTLNREDQPLHFPKPQTREQTETTETTETEVL